MTQFTVQVTYETMTTVVVDAHDLEAAIQAALADLRAQDPVSEPAIASVLDPEDLSGNGMPLLEWFAD